VKFSRPLFALCAVALIVLVAGCGGGSSSSSSSSASSRSGGEVTKAEFIEEADSICRSNRSAVDQFEKEAEEAIAEGESPKAIVEVADLIREVQPVLETEVNELTELEPPSADSAIIDQLFTSVEEQAEQTGELADALEAGENSKAREIEKEDEQANAKNRGIAQGYGFKACGSGE
jgi:hypothetical protein